MQESIERKLKERAVGLGFSLIGVARPDPSRHMPFYEAWLERGGHGEMAYLARPDAVERRGDPLRTMATARSVVVVAQEYFTEDPPGASGDPSRGVIARYARGRDYHKVLRSKLLQLLEGLRHDAGGPVEGRAYVDTGPLLERELAQRAGIGWFGRNTMLIHPRRGSWFFLGCLLVDLELTPDPPFTEDHCGSCHRCVEACPTGALLGRDADGAPAIDARLCISYLTIENRGPIPRALRPRMGNRVYGCDICQEVCPWNGGKFVHPTGERDYRPEWREAEDRPDAPPGLPGTEAPSLIALMAMQRDEWDLWTRGSPMRRTGYAGFKRNVAVAIGNWLGELEEPPEAALAVLRDAVEADGPLVREHAAWALERSERARRRRDCEPDSE